VGRFAGGIPAATGSVYYGQTYSGDGTVTASTLYTQPRYVGIPTTLASINQAWWSQSTTMNFTFTANPTTTAGWHYVPGETVFPVWSGVPTKTEP